MNIAAEPYPFDFIPERCALLIIDMQRDFLSRVDSAKCWGTTSLNCDARLSRTSSCWPLGARQSFASFTPEKGICPILLTYLLPRKTEEALR